jgi:hypothetical protein
MRISATLDSKPQYSGPWVSVISGAKLRISGYVFGMTSAILDAENSKKKEGEKEKEKRPNFR